jgi:hypothetical protein
MAIRVRLDIVVAGEPAGQAEIAQGHPFEIGRHGSACRIDDQLLSRRHFVLETVDDQLYLEDLQSANGTFLNGAQVEGRAAVVDGDRIEAGKSAFTVHIAPFEAQRIGDTGWLIIEVPSGWDCVPHLGLHRQEGERAASVICTQEKIPAGQTLDDYVIGQLRALKGIVAQFSAERLRPGEVGGEANIAASLAYHYDGKPVYQYQLYVPTGEDVGIVTWTKSAPASPDDINDFKHLIGHLSFEPTGGEMNDPVRP